MRRLAALLILTFAFVGTPIGRARAEDAFFFKSGDRVLFLGDSITEQYQYSTDIELYLTTRFPKWNLFFLNAGIGGDTAQGGNGRFAAHVLAEKPTAITIDFGMNDAAYGPFDANRNSIYVKSTEAMLAAAKNAGVRVALVSPNAVDRRVNDRFKLYLETQKQFYEPLKGLAAKFGDPFVDQYAVTRATLEKLEADGATKLLPFGDGVHTSPSGALLMAHAILVGLHAPAIVSNVEIDAAGGKPKTPGCAIENLTRSATGASFERTDEALPLPMQADWVPLLPYVDQLNDLNWYGLKVAGLPEGNYALAIDGNEVAKYTAAQLASGVNLGNLTQGPIYEQGQRVLAAINVKNQIVHQRFRGVVMFNAPDWLADVAAERKPKELAKRMDLIVEKQAEVHKLAQPVKHRFEVKPVK